MTRPEPRMSALTVSPLPPTRNATNTGKTGIDSSNGNARTTHNAGHAGNEGKPGRAESEVFTKLTVRVPQELAEEARAAFWQTSAHTRIRSLSAWIACAIEDKLASDRDTFNGGAHFSPLPPGQIPSGRRSS